MKIICITAAYSPTLGDSQLFGLGSDGNVYLMKFENGKHVWVLVEIEYPDAKEAS